MPGGNTRHVEFAALTVDRSVERYRSPSRLAQIKAAYLKHIILEKIPYWTHARKLTAHISLLPCMLAFPDESKSGAQRNAVACMKHCSRAAEMFGQFFVVLTGTPVLLGRDTMIDHISLYMDVECSSIKIVTWLYKR